MNSYISLMLEAEGAKERLQRLFQSTPEVKKNDQSLPLASSGRKDNDVGVRYDQGRSLHSKALALAPSELGRWLNAAP